MRMWMVDPKILCNNHLFGEHRELHAFVGTLNKGIRVKGYLEKGLLEVHSLKKRHEHLVLEILARGYTHKSPLPDFKEILAGQIDSLKNVFELQLRCVRCRDRISKMLGRTNEQIN